MSKKVAVLGAGAIGSSVGADLVNAGYDVVLIDQWPEHVQAMKANGLRVIMPDMEIHTPVCAYHLCEVCTLNQQFDVVLLAAKSGDTRWMAEFIKPFLKSEGVLVGLQNGMNDETIASVVGYQRTVGCVVELSAEVFTPGLVQRNTTHQGTWLGLGELHGRETPRVRELQAMLANAAKCSVTPNIWGAKWTKLITNTMTQGPIGMLGLKSAEGAEFAGMFELQIKVGRETIAVGNAHGYIVEAIYGLTPEQFMGSSDEILRTSLKTIIAHVGTKSRNAVVQDHAKKRYTEVDFINGVVVRKGREAGIPTPCNEAIIEITRRITAGELKPDPSNVALFRQLTS
jgi:2-dehydropantoate 2-reductase